MKTSQLIIDAVVIVLAGVAASSAIADPRAVIELFTSQGCSSCPPADRLLSELRNDPSLITLTLAVDYWDYIGWKDTLAVPGHTARQKAYSRLRGDREVYTPQVVVNGVAQALGSDRDDIEKAISQSRGRGLTLSLPINVAVSNGQVTVTLPNRDSNNGSASAGEVWLCPLTLSVAVGVGRGENRGKTLSYTNVVRRWVKLGNWSGKSETFSVPIDAIKSAGVDGLAVILQSGSTDKPGAMLGASMASLN